MNMKRREQAINGYKEKLNEQDQARLSMFKGLWDVQENHRRIASETRDYKVPDKNSAEAWYWQEKPFFLMAPVKIDKEQFVAALEDCSCYLLDRAGLKTDLSEKMKFFNWRALVDKSDLKQAGSDPMAYVAACCEIVEADEKGPSESLMVALVISYALRPLLEEAASEIMRSLEPALKEGNNIHDKPLRCPVCGGEALAACVGETPSSQGNGRLLYCAMCGTEWEFERIRCGHCGTRNQGHLHYFNIEGDDAHRLHNCQECGEYMRTVFREDLEVPFAFEVEDIVMARLDQVANDPRFNEDKV